MEDTRGGKLSTVKMNERVIYYIYKFLWVITTLLVFFHDRQSPVHKLITISLLIIMTTLLCFRVLESKKSWKESIDEKDLKN